MQVARIHVHRAAAHAVSAGSVQLAGVLVAGCLQREGDALIVGQIGVRGIAHVAPAFEVERQVGLVGHGRQATQQRAGACHHDGLLAFHQGMERLHAASDLMGVARLGVEGIVAALEIAQHVFFAHVGRHVACEIRRGILARNHNQGGLGRACEAGRRQEGTRGRGDRQGGVVARVQLLPESLHVGRFLHPESQGIDKHAISFDLSRCKSDSASRPAFKANRPANHPARSARAGEARILRAEPLDGTPLAI